MICPNCGKENKKSERYCRYCGRLLNSSDTNQYYYQETKEEIDDGILRDPLGYEKISSAGYLFHALLFVILYFGQGFIEMFVETIISLIITSVNQTPHPTNVNLFASVLTGTLIIALFIIIFRKPLKNILKKFLNGKIWGKAFVYFGIIYGCIIVYSILLMILQLQSTSANQDSIDAMTAMSPLMSGLYVCIFAPILEELMFRFGLFRALSKFGEKAAFIIVAIIFAGMHLVASVQAGTLLQDLTSLPVYLLGGITLTYAYMKEKNIAVPICVHFIYNTFGFLGGLLTAGII